jgi:hypothetical protein
VGDFYILLSDCNIISVIWWLSGLMVFYYLEELGFESYDQQNVVFDVFIG